MSEHGHNDALRRWDRDNWSLALASCFGVHVRLHLSLLVALAVIAIVPFGFQPLGLVLATSLLGMLLIHEVGHCLVAHALAGRTDEVLIWPLGGLAAPRIPHRPIETTLIQLGGPAANLLVCLVLLPIIQMLGGLDRELFNPFLIAHAWVGPTHTLSYFAVAFKVSYALLLINLIPCYPLDAGRILRELVAVHTSLLQATLIATAVGTIGAIIATAIALWYNNIWVASAAAAVAIVSFRKHRELELLGDAQENEFGYDFSEGYTSLEKSMSHANIRTTQSLSAKVRGWIQERKRRKGEFLEVELDRILAKIHDHGIQSLSRIERRILAQASRKRRK